MSGDSNSFLESCLWALIDAREDDALTVLLRKMLARAIVLLRSDSARPKALEVIKNVSNRVKTATGVKLPLKELLQVFNAKEASPFEKNFAMLFLEIGWKRGDAAELGPLVQTLLQDISRHQAAHQTALLQMALSALEHVGGRDSKLSWEGFSLPAPEAELFRSFLLDVLLFNPPAAPKPDAAASTPSPNAPAPQAPPAAALVSPGLSQESTERLLTKMQLPAVVPPPQPQHHLQTRKLPVVKALQNGLLSDEMALPLCLVASLAPHHEVRRAGEEALKHRQQKVDMDHAPLVAVLYHLLLGDSDKPSPKGPPPPPPQRRTPVDVPTRVAVLALLCRSVTAANTFPEALQAIFTCMYGAEASTRLKQGAMQLTAWTLRHASDAVLKPIAGVILSGLLKFIAADPSQLDGGQQAVALLRGFTYSAIGQLAQRAPSLFAQDLSIATRLFQALSSEPPEVKVSVQEALSMCCSAYLNLPDASKAQLMLLLQDAAAQPAHQARFCGVYWANRLFPFHDVSARYVCLAAVADAKVEVREEAQRGLALPATPGLPSLLPTSPTAEGDAPPRYPLFEDMVEYLSRPESVDARVAQSPAVKAAVVQFCGACLSSSCRAAGDLTRAEYLTGANADAAAAKTRAAQRFNDIIRSALEASLAPGGGKGVVEAGLARATLVALVDLFSGRRDVVAGEFGKRLQWLEQFLFCTNPDTRELVAAVLGELAADMPPEQSRGVVESLAASASPEQSLDRRVGALLGLGFVSSRGKLVEVDKETHLNILALLHASVLDKRPEVACAACRSIGLVGMAADLGLPIGERKAGEHDKAKEGAAKGGEGVGTKDGESTEAKEAKEEAKEEGREKGKEDELTVIGLLERVGKLMAGREKESKLYEAAAHCVGAVAVSNRSPEVLRAATELLFATAHTLRVEEFYLCVGEALACCCGGRKFTAPMLLAQLRLPAAYEDATKDEEKLMAAWSKAAQGTDGDEVLMEVLKHTSEKVLDSPRAQVRTSGGPWLLCLLRYNAEHPGVQERLKEMQQNFTALLGERSEFTQEVASKGLGLVYEMCKDEAMKDELVATLAQTLMSGGQPSKRRADDEQLFEEGQLKIDDKALGEGSLTTYKELCTVATELGQPDLIYRFLNLAGHQKVWTSRRGAAFGFSSIANQAADRLKPHLPTLIPKLYRYQYDPNEKIQEAMAGLWEMVVPDPAKAKEEYLPHMLKELIPGVGSRLWRVREASCLALADLLPGKRLHQVEEELPELHRMSLRAIDDVKETVRKAGATFCRAVSGLTLRLSDPDQSGEQTAHKTLGLILPLLIKEGICHAAEEVRLVSIHQLVKMTRHAGPPLRPFIPDLAVVLLESLSSLEPQMNTYLQLNADKYGVSQDTLERARYSAARNSPLTETLERCLALIDEATADELVPRLPAIIRTGVGLPTRAGVAKFCSQLAAMPVAAKVVGKHSAKLLKALRGGLADRSSIIRHAMAAAAAKVVAVGKEAAVEEYVQGLRDEYLEKGMEDAGVRGMVGLAMKELTGTAGDKCRDFLTLILPLAFLAKEDADTAAKETFTQVWEEGAGSTAAGVRVYGPELQALLSSQLRSSSWHLRRMSAKAAAAWVKAAGSSGLTAELKALLPALRSSVAGRIWEGKEEVLGALAALAVAAKEELPAGGDEMEVEGGAGEDGAVTRAGLAALVVAECAKRRKEYRGGALKAAEEMLAAMEVDVLQELLAAVEDLFGAAQEARGPAMPSQGKDADEEAQYESKLEEKSRDALRAKALAALAAAHLPAASAPSALASRAAAAPALSGYLLHALLHGAIDVRLAAVKACQTLAQLWEGEGEAAPAHGPPLQAEEAEAAQSLVAGLCSCMKLGGVQQREVRRESFRACHALVSAKRRRDGDCPLATLLGAEPAATLVATVEAVGKQELDGPGSEALGVLQKGLATLPS